MASKESLQMDSLHNKEKCPANNYSSIETTAHIYETIDTIEPTIGKNEVPPCFVKNPSGQYMKVTLPK